MSAEFKQQQEVEERLHHHVTFNKQVWDRLSAVDVNNHVQEKAGLKFLSWAWAWGVLMDHYPASYYVFREPSYYDDKSCEVWCTLVVSDGESSMKREIWLPVMDHKNKSIINPDSRAISDARMRCLTKCMAMCGLGHYIYAGEDVPQESKEVRDTRDNAAKYIIDALNKDDYSSAAEAWNELTEDEKKSLWVAKTKGGYFTQNEKTKLRDALLQNGEN